MAGLDSGKPPFSGEHAKFYVVRSLTETFDLSRSFGAQLKPGSIICFFGDLGAGKTTFIKGLVHGVSGFPPEEVTSPTFTYLNIYQGNSLTVYHFDLYRLRDAEEFLTMGFEDYLYAGGICCIEWSERIRDLLPPEVIVVKISHLEQEAREILIFW